MSLESLGSNRLTLAANQGLGDVTVRFGAFLEFSYAIAEDLQDLVAQWAHLAAPAANRGSGSGPFDALMGWKESPGHKNCSPPHCLPPNTEP